MTFRAFISVDIEDPEPFILFENSLKDTGADLKLVRPENIHMTLQFMGDISEERIDQIEESMVESVSGIKPFTINLSGTGAFPNVSYIKVIWVGARNTEPVAEIAKKLHTTLEKHGIRGDKKKFSPHITVARMKGKKHKARVAKMIENYNDHDFGTIAVDRIFLKKSILSRAGPTYSIVREIPFGQ